MHSTNPDMCRRVYDYLTSHPELHAQEQFFGRRVSVVAHNDYSYIDGDCRSGIGFSTPVEHKCGTTMCVAGAAVYLDALDHNDFVTIDGEELITWPGVDKASYLLGLNSQDAGNLFYTMEKQTVLNALERLATGETFEMEYADE